MTLTKVNGKQDFATAFTTGGTNVFDYFISNRDAAEWERGTGHMATTNTLVRDECYETSAGSTVRITFSAGTKDITNDVPAAQQVVATTVASSGSLVLFDTTAGNALKPGVLGTGLSFSGTTLNVALTSGVGIIVSGATVSAQQATTAVLGVTELANDVEYRANTAGNLALTPAQVWSAAGAVALSTATTAVTVDMSSFLTFATLEMSTPMTLSNPTSPKVGQHFIIRAMTTGTTACNLSLGTAYKQWQGTETAPFSVPSTLKLYVCGFVESSTGIIVTSVGRTSSLT